LLVITVDPQQRRVTDHPRLIGTSAALGDALELIERVAQRDVSVLILGESGVGKELLAREVHELSGRRGPVVFVNCATLPDNLVQSELFGHVRGAFSGAEDTRPGLVERARSGTLVLDEVGDSSPALQANLLRLLQEKEVRPVGSDHIGEVDIRFVASTNRPLVQLVRAGSFREDLHARLNRCVVRMPPLRERPEDILPLARLFAERFSGAPRDLAQPLALALLRHDWPGNVRSLQSVLERLVIESDDDSVLSVPPWLEEELAQQARLEPVTQSPAEQPMRPRLQLSTEQLRDLLRQHGGNITAVARELGVARNTVYRWVQRSGIDLNTLRR